VDHVVRVTSTQRVAQDPTVYLLKWGRVVILNNFVEQLAKAHAFYKFIRMEMFNYFR